MVNIQDHRLGEHNPNYRADFPYEIELFAIPSKNAFIYFMPRYQGVKYEFSELPFYLEGSLAALKPENFHAEENAETETHLKFARTYPTKFNDNTRTENGTAKISLDSLSASLIIKESLSGQYSTILRHLYLNENTDSTISSEYFRKCTDKPNASQVKITLSSHITENPFRYTFNCSEKIRFQNNQSLNLADWFSFHINKETFPELPTHDYYFDFDFTDSYNFLLEFSSPVEIKNSGSFTKKIDNDFFELESEIVKNSEKNYLVKAKLVTKKRMIPLDKVSLIDEIVDALELLNNFSLELVRK